MQLVATVVLVLLALGVGIWIIPKGYDARRRFMAISAIASVLFILTGTATLHVFYDRGELVDSLLLRELDMAGRLIYGGYALFLFAVIVGIGHLILGKTSAD